MENNINISIEDKAKEIKENLITEKVRNDSEKSELFYLLINAVSMIFVGVNQFQQKYMKRQIGLDEYDEFSFIIYRSLFIALIMYIKMKLAKENLNPFNILYKMIWFWIRTFVQFVLVGCNLFTLNYFRVATASCFTSMSPVMTVFLSTLLLKEKFYMRYIYGILICFCGVLLLLKNEYGSTSQLIGNDKSEFKIKNFILGAIFGLLALTFVSLQRVSTKILIKENINNYVQYIYPSLGCIVCGGISLLFKKQMIKHSLLLIFHCFINSLIWIIQNAALLMSLKKLELIKTNTISYLNMVTVFILGIIFLGENIYFSDILGSLVILGYNLYDTKNFKK